MTQPVIIGSATLYLGDSRVILPTIRVDAVVTDPPYGTGWARGGRSVGVFEAVHERPAWDVFDTEWLRIVRAPFVAVFGPLSRADELCAAVGGGVLWYRKTNPRPNGPEREPIAIRPMQEDDGADLVAYNTDCPNHPCEKPIGLMERLIHRSTGIVCDPYMGSGTTGVACVNLGRTFIGIEIEPRYFDIACERVYRAQQQMRLFQ